VESAVTIRRLVRGDADSILAVQSSCPELAPWSKRDYEAMAEGSTVGWVALKPAPAGMSATSDTPALVGFITARVAADEIEILNLGVDPNERRHGVAKALLKAAIAWGVENHARQAFLEVRASNSVAVQFYESFGFHAVGKRAKYYTSPVEDALQLAVQIQ
jgi:ribosomal-protein-alanine acetyltransferase